MAEDVEHAGVAFEDIGDEGSDAVRAGVVGEPDIHIPRVYWETTTSRMLTLERIYGIKIIDTIALDAAGLDRSEIAHRAARLLLKMIVAQRVFGKGILWAAVPQRAGSDACWGHCSREST